MILREALLGARERLRASGSDEAQIEAEVLICHALGIDRTMMHRLMNEPLSASEAAAFERTLSRRFSGEPVAYITGSREFFGLDFVVTPATLIPRPETEMLVEAAIDHLRNLDAPVIADIGTGSGAIAVSLATALPRAVVFATDISADALAVARQNAESNRVARRIAFRRGDLLEPIDCRVDVLAANLPYVTFTDWQQLPAGIREHEPRIALEAGADGLDAIRALLLQAPRYLRPSGLVLLEFGVGQAEAIEAAAKAAFPAASVLILNDFSGIPRLLSIGT